MIRGRWRAVAARARMAMGLVTLVAAVSAFSGAGTAWGAPPVAVDDGMLREWAQTTPVGAPDSETHVDIDGVTAVVGSVDVLDGSAYVYECQGGTWVRTQQLVYPGMAASDFFGNAVAIDGDVMVVGASRDGFGAAHVFRRVGGVWIHTDKLTAPEVPDPDETDFGFSVAVSGTTIVVGHPSNNEAGDFSAGAAFVFELSGGVWASAGKLMGPSGHWDEQAGRAVAVDGDVAVVGAPWRDIVGTPAAGCALVFERDASGWHLVSELTAGDPQSNSDFGWAVSASGQTIVVGSPLVGAAYVFERGATTWSQSLKLRAPDLPESGSFGSSVAVDGSVMVVGARRATVGALAWAGKAYVFDRAGTGWTQTGELTASIPAVGALFGDAIALSGNTTVIGVVDGTAGLFSSGPLHVGEDGTLALAAPGVLANDSDADNDVLTPTLLDTSQLHGVLAFGPGGGFIFTPEKDFAGTARATYSVSDGNGGISTASITITVVAVNDAPVSTADAATCGTTATVAFNVLTNDTDVDTAHALLTATDFSAPSVGVIQALPSGDVVYTPPANWTGSATFTYRAFDGTALSPPTLVTIAAFVPPVPPTPAVVPQPPTSTVSPTPAETPDPPAPGVAPEPVSNTPGSTAERNATPLLSDEATAALETSDTATPDETPTAEPVARDAGKSSRNGRKTGGTITLPWIGEIPASVVAAAPWCVALFALMLGMAGAVASQRRRDRDDEFEDDLEDEDEE